LGGFSFSAKHQKYFSKLSVSRKEEKFLFLFFFNKEAPDFQTKGST